MRGSPAPVATVDVTTSNSAVAPPFPFPPAADSSSCVGFGRSPGAGSKATTESSKASTPNPRNEAPSNTGTTTTGGGGGGDANTAEPASPSSPLPRNRPTGTGKGGARFPTTLLSAATTSSTGGPSLPASLSIASSTASQNSSSWSARVSSRACRASSASPRSSENWRSSNKPTGAAAPLLRKFTTSTSPPSAFAPAPCFPLLASPLLALQKWHVMLRRSTEPTTASSLVTMGICSGSVTTPRRSPMLLQAAVNAAPSRSILFTKATAGTPYLDACRHTVSVCACTPATASTTSTQPSNTRKLRSTSMVKSTWPGVSTKQIVWSLQPKCTAADWIVIPRSLSC
mmetsp:Transcript_23108/g.45914  ORF Transcript_23108/g.45914 Transcript_23108/m.45914 type:complete len:343 (-) Transcript_23108:272-1300(-)